MMRRCWMTSKIAIAAVIGLTMVVLLSWPNAAPNRNVFGLAKKCGLTSEWLSTLPRVAVGYAAFVFSFNLSTFDDQGWGITAPILFGLAICTNWLDLEDAQGNLSMTSFWGYGSIGISSVILMMMINIFLVRETSYNKNAIMSGKVCIVTGANCGIGFETAVVLSRMGATVVLGCRNEAKARDAMTRITQRVSYAKLYFIQLDLSSRDSIKGFAEKFNLMKLPLHVLVNNGGVIMGSHETNSDGIEVTVATNHLGPFLLTRLMLPKLLKNLHSRVVTVGSATHFCAPKLDFKSLENGSRFETFATYSNSKLCNLLFTKELHRRYAERGLEAFCVSPGSVATQVHRNLGWLVSTIWEGLGILRMTFVKSAREGANTSVHAATSLNLQKQGGSFIVNCRETKGSIVANDEALARKLWEWSEIKTSDFR